jgi:hypothetical protein
MRPLVDSIEEITGAVLLAEESSPINALEEQRVEDLSASHVIPDSLDELPAADRAASIEVVAAGRSDFRPAEDSSSAIPLPSPSRRIMHDLSEIWNQPQKRWVLAVGAAGLVGVMVGTVGLVVKLSSASTAKAVRQPPPVAASTAPAILPSGPIPPAESGPAASNPPPITEPVTTWTSPAPCAIAGAAHVIAPKAQIRIGVEAFASQNHLAIGFVTGDKDGLAVALESLSLTALATAKQHAHESIRRVVPMAGPGKTVTMSADVERKTDRITGARTIGGSGSFVLGSADGKLVWGAHASDTPHPLWSLDSDGPAEALRAVALETGGYAVAFRQGAAIYLGVLNADKTASGNLVHIAGLGTQVGSPTLGASGKTVIMAWADRASSSDPWGIRLLEWKRGEPPGEARPFSIPPGGLGEQAMSPGLAGLGGGRFLLAWTEGLVASHQVRAETIGAAGDVLGPALTISAEGVNAGQGQVAVLPDGKGLVVFMASPVGSTAEVVAAPVVCPPSPM